jgi:hypothetical protein
MSNTRFTALLPESYELPVDNQFLKMPGDGEQIRFQMVGEIQTGYSYWSVDTKCSRSRTKFTSTPNIKPGDSQREFWLLRVVQFKVGTNGEMLHLPCILEVTQKGIKKDLFDIIRCGDYDLGNYVMLIKAAGKGKQVKYSVLAVPIKEGTFPTDEVYDAAESLDLDAIIDGDVATDGEPKLPELPSAGSAGSF